MKKINIKIVRFFLEIKLVKPATYLVIALTALWGITILYNVSFFWPKNINYSFANEKTCFFNPTLLPNTLKKSSTESYNLNHKSSLAILGYSLFSKDTCVKMDRIQNDATVLKIYPLKNNLVSQKINIKLPEPPKLLDTTDYSLPVSTASEITLNLSGVDKTFSYRIKANDKTVACKTTSQAVICPLLPLMFEQSRTYKIEFERLIKEQLIGTVHAAIIKTVNPVTITEQTISPGSLIYDAPASLILSTNKDLAGFNKVVLTNNLSNTQVKISPEIKGNKLIVNFIEPLTREANFSLKIDEITAKDQAYLSKPYLLNFATSGGPKILGSNTVTYGESQSKNFVLNFDAQLLTGQDVGSLLTISGPSGPVNSRVTFGKSSLNIQPVNSLERCTTYTIKLNKGLKNSYGIENSAGWAMNFRTICQEVFSIGSSVQGRAITAYKFGNGSVKTIYVGATHGDELGSKYLLDSWVNELEANFHKIPANRTIYVVPLLNPDGFNTRSRVNASNVDLNRNFPANNWKPDVVMPGGKLVINGGGSSALSEPESKAIASFILAQSPELVLTYHSKGSMVIANEAGNSAALAKTYGTNSGYWARNDSELGTTFAYDTTGAMENWLYDKQSVATLLIELTTHTSNEFYRNKTAMWSMIQ